MKHNVSAPQSTAQLIFSTLILAVAAILILHASGEPLCAGDGNTVRLFPCVREWLASAGQVLTGAVAAFLAWRQLTIVRIQDARDRQVHLSQRVYQLDKLISQAQGLASLTKAIGRSYADVYTAMNHPSGRRIILEILENLHTSHNIHADLEIIINNIHSSDVRDLYHEYIINFVRLTRIKDYDGALEAISKDPEIARLYNTPRHREGFARVGEQWLSAGIAMFDSVERMKALRAKLHVLENAALEVELE